jgi:DNA polymerase III subunit delta
MTYEEIIKDLKNKIYHPIYFLQGEEPYFIDKISDYIQNNILDEGERSFNQTIVYGKDVDAKTLIDMLMRYPMMANHQVVILKEAQTMKGIEELDKYIKNPVKSTIFVVDYKYKTLDKRTKFWKDAVSKQVVFDSKPLYDNQLPAFINDIVKKHAHKIDAQAVATLVEYLGNDLSKIENEVEKLALNVPKTEAINVAHIEKFIGISKEYNIFELQKAIALNDKLRAYKIADYFMKNPKENPMVLVVGTLNSFFVKALQYLACGNDAAAKKAMYLNYYQEQDYKEYQKHFNREKTEKIFDILLEYDLKVKGVGYSNDKEPLIKELVYKILHA